VETEQYRAEEPFQRLTAVLRVRYCEGADVRGIIAHGAAKDQGCWSIGRFVAAGPVFCNDDNVRTAAPSSSRDEALSAKSRNLHACDNLRRQGLA